MIAAPISAIAIPDHASTLNASRYQKTPTTTGTIASTAPTITVTTPMGADARAAYSVRKPHSPRTPATAPATSAVCDHVPGKITIASAEAAVAATNDHSVADSAVARRELTPPAKSDAPQKMLETNASATPSMRPAYRPRSAQQPR